MSKTIIQKVRYERSLYILHAKIQKECNIYKFCILSTTQIIIFKYCP